MTATDQTAPPGRIAGGLLALVPLLALLGCRHASSSPPQADATFPGYPSPPLDDLVREAMISQPPPTAPAPYTRPAPIRVPPLVPPDLSWLPKDDQGRPILEETQGARLIVNTSRRDPITAKGACIALATHCAQRSETPNARTLDACWAYAPSCATDQPWLESAACCPRRCADLYARLRELGYTRLDATWLTMDSNCFNGRKEFLEAAR